MKICVVDDDPIYQFSFGKIASMIEPSLSTQVYENGEIALNGLMAILESQEEIPEMVFLDLNMPVMDGWNFLDEFSKIHHDKGLSTKVYIVSSSVHQEDIQRSKQYDIVEEYLVKPVPKRKLEDLLKK